jgi:hypothetical protein
MFRLVLSAVAAASTQLDCNADSEAACLVKPGCAWFSFAGNCTNCTALLPDTASITGCRDWKATDYCMNTIFSAAKKRYHGAPSDSPFVEVVRHYGITHGSGKPGDPWNRRQSCSVWCDMGYSNTCFGQPRAANELRGINYGGRFIPEEWMKLGDFFHNETPGCTGCNISLCDVAMAAGSAGGDRMSSHLDATIDEAHFRKMADNNFNIVRLPVGYWNVLDLPSGQTPNMPAWMASRWLAVQQMLASSDYQPYLAKVFEYSRKYGLRVLLDLHGAPGGQSGDQNSGCTTNSSGYFGTPDADYNIQVAVNAIGALATMCKAQGPTCYGVELLNEPSRSIDRTVLLDYYKRAAAAARGAGLDRGSPLVIMDWSDQLRSFWASADLGDYSQVGRIDFETHIYDWNSRTTQQAARDGAKQAGFDDYRAFAAGSRVFVGEWNVPNNNGVNASSLANWYVGQANQFGGGSFIWSYDGPGIWGAVEPSASQPWGFFWKSIFDGGF